MFNFHVESCSLHILFNSSPPLSDRTLYANGHDFRTNLFVTMNTSNAYVIFTSDAPAYLFIANMFGPKFRLMKETMECFYVGYQVPRASPNRAAIDYAVQLVRQAGLHELYMSWSIRFATGTHRLETALPNNANRRIDWAGIGGVFFGYGLGMFSGLLAFGIEHLFCAAKRHIY